MSSVSADAALMLEKALEEMDDIFRQTEEPNTFVINTPQSFTHSHTSNSASKTFDLSVTSQNIDLNNSFQNRDGEIPLLLKILDELQQKLSVNLLCESLKNYNSSEMQSIQSYCDASLPNVAVLFKLCFKGNQTTSTTTSASGSNNSFWISKADSINFETYDWKNPDTISPNFEQGPDETIHRLEREKQTYLEETRKLHSQLLYTESELEKTKKVLADYARKNEELLIRMTEQRVNEQKKQKVNHNKLLLDDDRDFEMDRLKNHIDLLIDEQEKRKSSSSNDGEDSVSTLKTRLREKASECNRLKVQIEELKLMQETKDNTMLKIQEQIKQLFQENENLRQQLGPTSSLQSNGTHHAPLVRKISNGSLPRTPETTSKKYGGTYSTPVLQIKGLKSASEPNLIHGERRTVGLTSSGPMSVSGDETIYRPYKRLISESPFATWTSEQVQDWFRDEGLEEYTNACSKCVKKGEDLLKFTHAEYEKYLGISNPIHRKKLNLALKAVTSNSPDYAGRLDHNWVARWLDDLGLPQYRQTFYFNRVDGRVLINMTLDDVLQLKVFNLLHHTSLKRAIQFLRHQKFHPQYLREVANQSEERCDHVMLWTNQRIKHWLRSVDLAEYAPNLTGSGVHGGLMVLESRFNADTLANLLSIPLNKSLIRKHVSSQFSTLLGDACQRQKDMTQRTSDFVPLNGSDKHKLRPKKGLNFGSLRRRKSETDLESLVCPMELDVSNIYSPPPALDPEIIFDMSESASLSPSFTNDNGSESTNETSSAVSGVPRIADLSQEIEQMTSMLGSDQKY